LYDDHVARPDAVGAQGGGQPVSPFAYLSVGPPNRLADAELDAVRGVGEREALRLAVRVPGEQIP
jgi:hypothetical protein